eukprot:TRINITY_DN9221_c0_g1_i1.p1 TRINITY_DN9221_c0_g1~~TRINITY_DN9221_c0_g1_i1.p1  ORF type:complete len:197 (+),score=68.92 TRINITY_DN9221_c0_g1_i1:53-592(+)
MGGGEEAAEAVELLSWAHTRTQCAGSSTAAVLVLMDNVLDAANVGDSGWMLVRRGQVAARSWPQQHAFNMPYQLSVHSPLAAEVQSIEVETGDILVLGSDGLYDNMHAGDIVSCVMRSANSRWSPQKAAEKLASQARVKAADASFLSPYAIAAREAGFCVYGGKMDDIVVIVAYVEKVA